MVLGIVLLVIGIIGRLFASVTHITDSTVKAMGWTLLNKVVGIISWILIVCGALATFGGIVQSM